ncbi:MAG: HAMP domain-containing protein [Actinobacteria bacterium]|nr:HAMP domain-containing protein [Actinomycetota bacterium]
MSLDTVHDDPVGTRHDDPPDGGSPTSVGANGSGSGDRTLRREVGLAFGVTAVWPITVVAVAIMCWALIAQFTTVQRDRQQVAARVGRQTKALVDLTTRSMRAAAAFDDPAALTPDGVRDLLGRLLATQTELDELTFVDAGGRLVAAASTLRQVDPAEPPYEGITETAAAAIDSGELAIGGIGFNRATQRWVVAYAVPTSDLRTGRVSGAFVGLAPLRAVEELLAEINAETDGSAHIVTADGRLVADADFERVRAGASMPDVSDGVVRDVAGRPVIAGTAPLRVAGIELTAVSAQGVVAAMAPAALAMVPSALLLGLVVVSRKVRDRLTRRIVEPVEALTDTTRTLADGDLTARVAGSDIVEFDHLATDFNGMAARLEDTVDSLADRSRRLAESNRELEDFASIAAHDLREPLRKVQFFGDRLHRLYGERLDEQGRDYIARMSGAARRMAELIDSLLTYSRVSTKAAPFEQVDLSQTAREVLGDLEARVAETGADVTVGALPIVEADPTQMRQLLQNLISNALKYRAPDRAVRVAVTASGDGASPPSGSRSRRGMQTDGDPVRLRVQDNGIGIDPAKHDDIFRVFTRLHGRSEYEGTGIGLAVCRRIAERHSGSIAVQSQPGEGSTFIVSLPRQHSSEPT